MFSKGMKKGNFQSEVALLVAFLSTTGWGSGAGVGDAATEKDSLREKREGAQVVPEGLECFTAHRT